MWIYSREIRHVIQRIVILKDRFVASLLAMTCFSTLRIWHSTFPFKQRSILNDFAKFIFQALK